MRNLAYLLLSITLASPLSALALGTENPDYDQCILQSLANSQSNIAANVIRRSATGRSLRARASVVVILPCSNSAVARFAIMCR